MQYLRQKRSINYGAPDCAFAQAFAAHDRQPADARLHAAAQGRKSSGNVNDNPYKKKAAAQSWIGPRPGFAWVRSGQHGTQLAALWFLVQATCKVSLAS